MTTISKRVAAFLAGLAVLVSGQASFLSAAAQERPSAEQSGSGETVSFDAQQYPSYTAYRQQHEDVYPDAGICLEIPIERIEREDGAAVQMQEVLGRPALRWNGTDAQLTWRFTIEQPGLYTVSLDYALEGSNAFTAKRNLLIDGEIPFEEALGIAFSRCYEETGKGKKNSWGDDMRGQNVPIDQWYTHALIDSSGISERPFELYFTAGEHTVTLAFDEKDMAVGALRVQAAQPIKNYAEVREDYAARGLTGAPADAVYIFEAEDAAAYTNDVTIRRENSNDITTTPYSATEKWLNIYGGTRWDTGNQSVTFNIEVKKDGLYKLALHACQNVNDGLPVYRQIAIDGEVPFAEMLAYQFPYSKFDTFTLADESGEPFLFYLEAGQHTLTMTVKLGDMAPIASSLREDMLLLSAIQLAINKLTGNEVDANYDYEFFTKIPTLEEDLQTLSESLQWKISRLQEITGRNPSMASSLKSMKQQVDAMRKDPFSIARNLSDFRNTQTSLGTWYTTLLSAPMMIDKITVAAQAAEVPVPKRSFWKLLLVNLQSLFSSFVRSYSNISGVADNEIEITESIDVWVARGTEWAELIKELSDSLFSPNSGIEVNVNTVPPSQLNSGSANALMLSIISGRQPDVAMGIGAESPVEFAIRDAVADLSKMEGFDEVYRQFYPEIFVPYRYNGGIYALPETMDFKVLFYRRDILSDLQIPIPDTRAQLYQNTLPALYREGLKFYYSRDDSQFILQYGGQYYTDDGLRSALDSPEVYAALKEETELYTQYAVPVTANFYNMFRTGEMPMGIGSYATYMQLSVAAPEISGMWGIAPLPGMEKADGTVDRSNASFTSMSDCIMQKSEKQEAAWEFLKWWASTETQTVFSREVEALLGAEARWNTANIEAFHALPWKAEDLEIIDGMLQQAKEIPVVLGGYYTTRHLTNAWNKVVINGVLLRDALEEAVEAINKELKMKQEEYGVH